jgi:hypothetical protein
MTLTNFRAGLFENFFYIRFISRAGIATGYGLDDRIMGFRFPAGAANVYQ